MLKRGSTMIAAAVLCLNGIMPSADPEQPRPGQQVQAALGLEEDDKISTPIVMS